MTQTTEIYQEGIGDFVSRGVNSFRRNSQGISDRELNSVYNIFKKYSNPQALEAPAKQVLSQMPQQPQEAAPTEEQPQQAEAPAADPAQPAPVDAPPAPVADEQAMSAQEIAAEAEAEPAAADPTKSPEDQRKEAAAKGGHIAQILKKVGLAKTPTSRVLSQSLMTLSLEDIIAVKNAAIEQADKLAKRQQSTAESFTELQGVRIIEHSVWMLKTGRLQEPRIF